MLRLKITIEDGFYMQITPKMTPYQLVWRFLKPHKVSLFIFIMISLLWASELSISPFLLKLIIDGVNETATQPGRLLAVIALPAGLYVSMSLLLNIVFRIYGITYLYLFSRIREAAISSLFDYVSNHSYQYFQEHFTGSLSSKLKDVTEGIETLISLPNEVFFPRLIAALIASFMLLLVSPALSIVLLVWCFFFTLITFYFTKRTEKLALPYSEQSTELDGQINDAFSNIITTKLFAQERFEYGRIKTKLKTVIEGNKKVLWKMQYAHFTQAIMVTILVATVMIILIRERQQGLVTVGDFAFVLALKVSISMQIWDIGQHLVRFSKEVSKVQQALNTLTADHAQTDMNTESKIKINQGEISFQHAGFSYVQNNILFQALNVTIHGGQKIGLVGPSGGGKSSFIKLIMRLFDLEEGRIVIDGQDISTCTMESLRKQIAVIPQDPDLFHRSILDNIAYAKPNASFDEITAAAKKAHCHEFIESLEQGYQTKVGERGVKLSGGQKQRISIARAILKNAPILIFDEATSALDSVTERYIQDSLHDMMKNKTTLVIAHRLSTLSEMDRILYFKDGEILEDGALDELIESGGHFAALWSMQSAGYVP